MPIDLLRRGRGYECSFAIRYMLAVPVEILK